MKIHLCPIVFILLQLACSGWERSNPLDPKNPETGGKVTGVSLSAIDHDVTISWDPVGLSGIIAYPVYRKQSKEDHFRQIGAASSSSFFDSGRPYEEEIGYAVTARTRSGYESPLSDSLFILPGPHTFWMLDYYDGSIQRLTYDGRYRISLTREAIWPTAAAVDTIHSQIWIVDWVTGYLVGMDERGDINEWISGLSNPAMVACDPTQPEIWVADGNRSRITCFDGSGNVSGALGGFEFITGLCWSGQPGLFWVADQGLAKIQLVNRSGESLMLHSLSCKAPPVIDCYLKEGWIMAADSLQVIRIHVSGQTDSVATIPLTGYDISIDQKTGGCWIILIGQSDADEVIHLDPGGGMTVRTTGYHAALAVAAVPGQRGCLVADTGKGRMVRLKQDGQILSELTGLVSPWDAAVY